MTFGFFPRRRQLVLAALQGQDAGRQYLDGQLLLGLKGLVEVLQPRVHIGKLAVDGRQPAVDLTGDVVDLLGHQGHQLGDGLLGENPLPDLLDYQVLHLVGIQVAPVAARSRSLAEQAGADVVGELAALGSLGGVGLAADTAAEQTAQEVLAADPSGPSRRGRPLVQPLLHGIKGLPGNQRGPGTLHPYRLLRFFVLALDTPDSGAGVGLVGQEVVDDVLLPAPSPVGDAPPVRSLQVSFSPLPRRELSNISLTMGAATGSTSRVGRSLTPSLTLMRL